MALTKITNSAIADDIGLGGNPTTSTQTAGDSTTRIATTAFVSTAVANLVDSAPDTLNTLAELATSIGNSTTLSSTLTSSIATKLPLAGGTLTGNLNLGDNVRARFGLDSDLQIYHDGNDSWIRDVGTSDLYIDTNGLKISLISDGSYANGKMADFVRDGAVTLYHDNSPKIATTATGIDVTGIATMDGLTVNVSADSDSVATITSSATANNTQLRLGTSGNDSVISGSGGSNGGLKFKVYGSEKMAISSAGNVTINGGNLDVTGNIAVTGTVDGIDIAARDAVLTSTTTTAGAALPKAGGTMTGGLSIRGFNGPVLKLGSSGTSDPRIDFEDQNSTNLGAGIFLDQDADTLRILRTVSGSATDGIAINASGNVGIGTAAPADRLHVALDSSTTNAEVEVMRVEATSSGTPAVGFGPFIDFRGDRINGGPDSYGRLGFEADAMPSTTVDGAFVVQTAEDGNYSERLRITSGGNVGIGDDNPSDKFVVKGDAASIGVESADMQVALLGKRSSSGVGLDQGYLRLRNQGVTADGAVVDSAGPSFFNGGNVGIGTSSPNTQLQINSATDPKIRLESNESGSKRLELWIDGGEAIGYIAADQSASQLAFKTAGTERMRIDSSGNVGIGTSNPAQNFVVAASTNGIGIELVPGTLNYIQAYNRGTSDYGDLKIDAQTIRFGLDNGAEAARFDSDGRLAIGNTTTAADADIPDNIKLVVAGGVIVGSAAGNDNSFLGYRDIGGLTVLQGSGNYGLRIFDDNSTTPRFQVNRSGNVGIGTASPEKNLSIGSSQAEGIQFNFDTTNNYRNQILNYWNSSADSRMDFNVARASGATPSTIMSVGYNSNVGIGTTSPTSKLEVIVTQSDTMTDDTAAFAIKGNGGDGILMGQRATTPYAAWIAAGYLPNIGTSHNYPLTLQPHGGNVGIGTTAPTFTAPSGSSSQKGLHIANSGNDTSAHLRLTGHNNTGTPGQATYSEMIHRGDALRWDFNHNGNVRFSIGPDGHITVANNMYFEDNGQIRMGASHDLQLYHDASDSYIKDVGTGNLLIQGSDIYMGNTSSNHALVIRNSGNVGIGATGPSEKLEVDGGIKISNSNSRLYFGAEGGTSYRALEGNTGGSLLQVGEGYSSIALQGNVAINTTTTYDTALRVVGATSTVNGHGDLASISTETGSVVSSGSIKHEIGYSGTYSSGKTWTWTYAATSWKSFHVSLKVASTAGFSSYEGGGYNNNGGPMNTVEHGNDLGSLVITRSGQQMIMTYTTNTTHIHPFFELTYRQSGGDGSPRMDRLSLVQT